jgi:hypothetical protein
MITVEQITSNHATILPAAVVAIVSLASCMPADPGNTAGRGTFTPSAPEPISGPGSFVPAGPAQIVPDHSPVNPSPPAGYEQFPGMILRLSGERYYYGQTIPAEDVFLYEVIGEAVNGRKLFTSTGEPLPGEFVPYPLDFSAVYLVSGDFYQWTVFHFSAETGDMDFMAWTDPIPLTEEPPQSPVGLDYITIPESVGSGTVIVEEAE